MIFPQIRQTDIVFHLHAVLVVVGQVEILVGHFVIAVFPTMSEYGSIRVKQMHHFQCASLLVGYFCDAFTELHEQLGNVIGRVQQSMADTVKQLQLG